MTTLQIADNLFPQLHLQDSVEKALQLMNDLKATHLPVVADDKFLGLISEEDLTDEKGNITLEFFQSGLVSAAVNVNNHFLKAAAIFDLYHTNVVAVINENNELVGTISAAAMVAATAIFCGSSEYGALVVLEIERTKFAISEINSIVESDGATILHLNVAPHPNPLLLEVTVQINKKEISAILATFERYEYSVSYYSGEEMFENEISSNYDNLMSYLKV